MADKKPGGQRTDTTPDHARAPYLGTDPVVAFWAPALGVEIEIPDAVTLTLGAGADRDVVIKHASISRRHARIERRGDRLFVVDDGSKNGIAYGGRACADCVVSAGDGMKFGEVVTLAMTGSMVKARRRVAFWLGYGATVASDEIAEAAHDRSFLIIGEPGPRLEVARALHLATPRRDRPVLEITAPVAEVDIKHRVGDAAGGAAFVDGYSIEEMPSEVRSKLAKALADEARNLAVYWLTNSRDVACARFGNQPIKRMREIVVPLVSARVKAELPALLDALFAAMAAPYRARSLGPEDLRALAAYHWPEDHAELAACARYLASRLGGTSQRQTAPLLDLSWGAMQRTIKRWGVSL